MQIITLEDRISNFTDEDIKKMISSVDSEIADKCYICQECEMSSDDHDCESCSVGGQLDNLYDELSTLCWEKFKREQKGGVK